MTTDLTKDDELLARLRSLAGAADPVPDDVILSGRSAIAYRDLDVRLAELVEEETTAGVRGDDEPWFVFEVDDVMIELAIRARGDSRSLVGQVDGPRASMLTVRHRGDEANVPLDDLGRFSTPVNSGPLRVELTLNDGRRIATSWILNTAP